MTKVVEVEVEGEGGDGEGGGGLPPGEGVSHPGERAG